MQMHSRHLRSLSVSDGFYEQVATPGFGFAWIGRHRKQTNKHNRNKRQRKPGSASLVLTISAVPLRSSTFHGARPGARKGLDAVCHCSLACCRAADAELVADDSVHQGQ